MFWDLFFLKFAEKFVYLFLYVFIFANMLPDCHGFGGVLVTRSNNFICLHKLHMDKLKHASLIMIVTGIATKLRLSRNMFPNIKTCKNRWSDFSKNLRIVALKLLKLTWFLSPNLSVVIYCNFVWFWDPMWSLAIFSAQSFYWEVIIIIYHDFLPIPRRGSHVKWGQTHTQSSRYTP